MVQLGIYFQGSSLMTMLISLLSSLLWLSVQLYVQILGQISKSSSEGWIRPTAIYHDP